MILGDAVRFHGELSRIQSRGYARHNNAAVKIASKDQGEVRRKLVFGLGIAWPSVHDSLRDHPMLWRRHSLSWHLLGMAEPARISLQFSIASSDISPYACEGWLIMAAQSGEESANLLAQPGLVR